MRGVARNIRTHRVRRTMAHSVTADAHGDAESGVAVVAFAASLGRRRERSKLMVVGVGELDSEFLAKGGRLLEAKILATKVVAFYSFYKKKNIRFYVLPYIYVNAIPD